MSQREKANLSYTCCIPIFQKTTPLTRYSTNKIKVDYSCIQNIKTIINNHNINILHQNNEIKDGCNCRNRKCCPLGGKCLLPNIV